MLKLLIISAAAMAVSASCQPVLASVSPVSPSGKIYGSNGIQYLPAVGLHSSGRYAPLLFSSQGKLQTTTSNSSYNPIAQVSVPISSGRILVSNPDGSKTFAAPLAGMDSQGVYQALLVDGSGKLLLDPPVVPWGTITGTLSDQLDISSALALKEVLANKSTDGTMAGNSDTSYPSQKAAKTYTDSQVGYKVGPGRKYTTIQSALNAIGDAASVADLKKAQVVFIAGGTYDEDLAIPRGRIITLLAEGTVVLGNGLGSNWSSTNSRSITATFNSADVFGSDVKPALNISSYLPSDATSTFIAEAGMFRISGNLVIAGDGLSNTVNLHGVWIDGQLNQTTLGLTNLQAYQTLFAGTVNASNALVLERCEDCQFNSLVTINAYNALLDSEVRAGMTVSTNQPNLPPSGFFSTTFTGTFTGPANSLRLDPVSDYYFTLNAASLGGSATKVLLKNDTTVTTSVSGSKPSCVVARRGMLWNIDGGAGVADIFQICQKNASDVYGWVSK